MLLTSEQIKNYRGYAMSAEPNVRTLQRFFLAVSEDWITLSDEVERTRRLVERDTATIKQLSSTIREWEESDRARVVFTDLIDEGQREIARLTAALQKVRSYNADILDGRMNYRAGDHIFVIDEALSPAQPVALQEGEANV